MCNCDQTLTTNKAIITNLAYEAYYTNLYNFEQNTYYLITDNYQW